MVFYTPKFSVGDPCVIESFKSKESGTRNPTLKEYVKATIAYVHPAHGWSTCHVDGYNIALFNNEIMTPAEFAIVANKYGVTAR